MLSGFWFGLATSFFGERMEELGVHSWDFNICLEIRLYILFDCTTMYSQLSSPTVIDNVSGALEIEASASDAKVAMVPCL